MNTKFLENKLDLIILVLGKTLNGVKLTDDELRDIKELCNQSEEKYLRNIEMSKAFQKHMSLSMEMYKLEQEFPELRNKFDE
jgi:benzoyl-CoA reductase/2-hydroxyglutaryl-CoA dehydratase subunit BcrC/BadD/HgdB